MRRSRRAPRLSPWCVPALLGAVAISACTDSGDQTTEGNSQSSQASTAGTASTEASADTTETSAEGTETGPAGEFSGLRFEDLEVEGDWGMVTDLRFVPGTSELLMLEKSGRVGHLRLEDDGVALLGSFQIGGVYSVLDCGLISLALDPDFATNGLFYVGLCTSQEDSEIRRYTLDATDVASTADSEALILAVSEAEAPKPWHNVGSLGFDPDGTMWALFGDKKVTDNGQDAATPLSSLVRLIPDRTGNGGYTPAPDNPFAGDDGDASPLVFATGLRSPWKGIRDDAGRYWFGDVGANTVEEINVVSAPGQNFGWPIAEGPCESSCEGLTDPVTSWPHKGVHRYAVEDEDVVPTNARVAYVGLQVRPPVGIEDPYRGALDGHVLAGDYCQGYVRGLLLGDDQELTEDLALGHLHVPSAWGQGPDGFIYAATFGKCETPGIDEDDPPSSRFVRAHPRFE